MPKRIIQFEDVCKIGMTGAIMHGDFLGGDDDTYWTPDLYVRQALALAMIQRDNGEGVYFDYQTGKPQEITPNFFTATFKCVYQVPMLGEGDGVVVAFSVPDYMKDQAVSGVYIGGNNYESADKSEVTGGTQIYFDEACTITPDWLVEPVYGEYFMCPDMLYFKIKAGSGGSTPAKPHLGYSQVILSISYAPKDSLEIYQ